MAKNLIQMLRQLFLMLPAFIAGISPQSYAQSGCSSASFKISTRSLPPGMAFAGEDFNHDGHLDLAMIDSTYNEIVISLGRGGSLGFEPPVTFATPFGSALGAAGDFNGDTHVDLIIGTNHHK
jgi:hypothetical protein